MKYDRMSDVKGVKYEQERKNVYYYEFKNLCAYWYSNL